MREIASPLSGPFTTFGQTPIDIYKVGAYRPELAYSFYNEYYRRGRQPVNFLDAITHTRNGNATMTDSSGNIVWAPHNLALNSATPATQSITVVSGADYTVECTGVSIALSGAGTGTVTEGNPVEITASTTTLTLTVTGSSGTMWAYRSDLGGMADNPDRGDSYVPTTSAARYLPRRGHHVYNGSQWVNKGLLHESEARTNLITYSDDLSNGVWAKTNASFDLATNTLTSTAGGAAYVRFTPTYSDNTTYTFSATMKAGTNSWVWVYLRDQVATNHNAYVNLSTGEFGTITGSATWTITSEGNGWYRVSGSYPSGASGSSEFVQLQMAASDGNVSTLTNDTIKIKNTQLEAGSTPSSYIPTNGATVTRPAESITIPAANLPWPEPVYVTNEELVTNGTFDTDTSGWIGADCSIAAVSGELEITSDGTTQYGYANAQSIPVVVGETYVFSGTYISGTGNGTRFTLTGATTRNVPADNATTVAKTLTFSFVAQSTSLFVQGLVYSADGTSRTGYFDNVSVKEINPLALSIQMKGEMTYADEDAARTVEFFQWEADANNEIYARVDTRSGDTGQPEFLQIASGVADLVSAGATTYSPDINVPFNISSRHGSTFLNGAIDGVALTANTTPVALPDLSSTDLDLAYDFMGTISLFRVWAEDIGDTGIEEAST